MIYLNQIMNDEMLSVPSYLKITSWWISEFVWFATTLINSSIG